MAGRHSRAHATRHDSESRVPAWVWLFTGAVVGAFVMFLLRLSEVDAPQSKPEPPPKVAKAPEKKEDTKPDGPRFDFYELLKETEVPVLGVEEGSDSVDALPPAEDLEYILQVASFKNAQDAEELRVNLLLLNLEAHIEKAKIRNGETWHRVLVGPFESRSQLSKARETLVSNKYEALVLKRTNEKSSG